MRPAIESKGRGIAACLMLCLCVGGEAATDVPAEAAGDIGEDGIIEASVRPDAPVARRSTPTELTIEEIRELSANAPPPEDFWQRLDHGHDQVYTWVQSFVEATDRRFASQNDDLKPVPAAPFRLGLDVESLDRDEGLELNLRADFDIALRLPNIETRLRLFVTSNELDESPRDARTENAVRAGLRYELLRHIDFDIGVKLDLPPVAFMSLRWQHQYALGSWDVYPLAKLFAETEQGLGYVGALTFDRWSGRNLVRSSSYAKFRSDRDRIEWTQTFIYARANELIVPDRYGSFLRANDIGHGWGVRLLASGGEDFTGTDYYEAGFFFRRPAPNRWMYWYFEPLVRFDKEYDWDADPGFRIGIDMLFWDLARPGRR
jgi:hypothetical protein